MTAPYFDNSPQASMKRRLQGPLTGTPDSFLPETPGPGQYTLSEIGNATVSRPDHTLRNRILGGLDGVLHGIAATADPNDEGLAGQIGGFARGYSATTDLVERNKREQLAARIAAQTAQEEADLRRAQANYYNAGVPLREAQTKDALAPKNNTSKNSVPMVMTWQRLGYPSFEAWQRDQQLRPRNIDPLSPQGIGAAVTRAQRVGGAIQNPTQVLSQTFRDRASAGSDLLNKTPTPSVVQFETGQRLSPSLRPEAYRLWRQAAEQFITAVLRKESGAAISDGEFARYTDIFIPTPGDSPELLARKQAAREREIRNLDRSGHTNEQGSGGSTDYTPPPE